MNIALIIMAITVVGGVSTAVIQNKVKSSKEEILNRLELEEINLMEYVNNTKESIIKIQNDLNKVQTETIVEAIDDTDIIQANDLADILDKLDSIPEELKKVIIQQLVIPVKFKR